MMMASILSGDLREYRILETRSDTLDEGWSLLIDKVGAVEFSSREDDTETDVRVMLPESEAAALLKIGLIEAV